MKKLILNDSTFQQGEVLTRSQLKKVLGGWGSAPPERCSHINECTIEGDPCPDPLISGVCTKYICTEQSTTVLLCYLKPFR